MQLMPLDERAEPSAVPAVHFYLTLCIVDMRFFCFPSPSRNRVCWLSCRTIACHCRPGVSIRAWLEKLRLIQRAGREKTEILRIGCRFQSQGLNNQIGP